MLKDFLLAAGLVVIFGTQIANAQSYDWIITGFESTATLTRERTLTVTEDIDVNFVIPSHGIFRTIPLEYQNNLGLNYNLRMQLKSITDENGKTLPYSTSWYSGSMTVEMPTETWKNGNVLLRIGDPDILLTGKHHYRITYMISNPIRFFDDHDEIYWNVTGDQWETDIQKASFTLNYPETPTDQIKTNCFTGEYGSTEQACSAQSTETQTVWTISPKRTLAAYEGFTAALWLPKGIITPPSAQEILIQTISDNVGLMVPVIVLIWLIYQYRRFGRDPGNRTVVVEFEPPDKLTPAEMGTVIDESADLKDISAEIIHLAVNGYLTITEEKTTTWIFSGTDYVLKKTGKAETGLQNYQKEILMNLFKSGDEVKLSELTNKFYSHIDDIGNRLYSDVVTQRKYFPENPNKVRNRYMITGIILLFVSVFSFGFLFGRFDIFFGMIVSAILILCFGPFMPRKTPEGAECHRKILGFKDYINTAEKYRVKFQEDKNIFEKYLPYAMIFGLAAKWGKAFEGIYHEPPKWYAGTGPFSPYGFSNNMTAFAQTANSTLASRPSKGSSGSSGFGGGGFSGGGFGGGGGGRW